MPSACVKEQDSIFNTILGETSKPRIFSPSSHKRLTLLIKDAKTTRQRYQIHPVHLDSKSVVPCKMPNDVMFIANFIQSDETPIKDKLRYVRLMAGLKQIELASLVGIDRSTLNRLENGVVSEKNMKTDLLLQIALVCGFEKTFCCNRYHKFLSENSGEKIRAFRKERKMTQQDLANLFQVNKKTIEAWEHNRNNPPIERLEIMFPEWFFQNEQGDDP